MAFEYKNIMVPVDGSEQSIQAFKKAVSIAKRNDATLRLVTILDKKETPTEANEINNEREALFRALEEYSKRHHLAIQKDVKYGNAKKLISEELVKDWEIDLIVMGASGKGQIAKMVVGSVTNHVVRHARCDVLIAR